MCVIMYLVVFFFNETATTEIYTYLHTLSLHDALPISSASARPCAARPCRASRMCCRMQIGRATSELQSLMRISYAVFCLKKKTNNILNAKRVTILNQYSNSQTPSTIIVAYNQIPEYTNHNK